MIKIIKKIMFPVLILVMFMAASCEPKLSATKTPPYIIGNVFFAWGYYGDQDERIDVVFIPDAAYGDMTNVNNLQAFLDDVAGMIGQGFFQNNGITMNWSLFNFWYMTETGTVQAPPDPCPAGQSCICPTVTWPDLSDAAFADSIVLLHTNTLRDCAWGNQVTSEPDSYRTVVHEFSHAVFGLPDEYCCDGGYWNSPPVLYNSRNACENDPLNDPNLNPWWDCQSFTSNQGTTWWRSEDDTDDIMSTGGVTVLEYGHADWMLADPVLGGLGQLVNDPTVFAPDTWDRPWQP